MNELIILKPPNPLHVTPESSFWEYENLIAHTLEMETDFVQPQHNYENEA